MMEDAGINDPDVLHYGELKSRNTFTGETVGLVLGRIDLGTDNVLAMMGLLGLDTEPVPFEDTEANYRVGGPDADAGMDLLNSVRVCDVQQAVGRYAREARNPDDHATVYVWTNVLPPEWVDERVDGVTQRITDTDRRIERVVRESDEIITRSMIEQEADVSRVKAWDTLNRMTDEGLVTCSLGSGPIPDEYQYVAGTLQPRVNLGSE
jgi:hypothetical protein